MSIAALIELHTEQGEPIYVNPSRILSVERYQNHAHAECHSRVLMNIPNLAYLVTEKPHEVRELVGLVVKAKG